MNHPGGPVASSTILDPAIFWYWNATPTRADIERRLDDFLSRGLRAVYIHPMPDGFRREDFHGGMEVPYLSDAFFELVTFTCEQARRRSMHLWMYDEGGWPSGVAGGAVVKENPAHGMWALKRDGRDVRPVQFLDRLSWPDLMNRDATASFLRHTHERYRRVIGDHFGKTVPGIFTDEPRLLGRVGTDLIPWSPGLPPAFVSDHGQTLEAVLARLFDGAPLDDETLLARRGYIKTVSRLIAANYFQPIREWCERHGLLFEGHHSGENEFGRHGQYFGDYLEQARHYHVPGVDTIWRQIFPGKRGGNFVSLASSASWRRGMQCASSESFNVYGAGLTIEQMRWIAGFQIVRGVNRIALMPSLHSTAGARRISTCGDFSPAHPSWRDLDLYVDWQRRAARFSASGAPVVRVGIFYRAELVSEEEQADFDRRHEELCEAIHDQHTGLAFVGAADLETAGLDQGVAQIGDLSLHAIVIHASLPLTDRETKALQRVALAGVRLIWLGDLPGWKRLGADLGDVTLEHAPELGRIDLRGLSLIRCRERMPGVRLLAVSNGGSHRFLFFNQNLHSVEFEFEVTGLFARDRLQECELEQFDSHALRPIHSQGSVYHLHLFPGELRAFEAVPDSQTRRETWNITHRSQIEDDWAVSEVERFTIEDAVVVTQPARAPIRAPLSDYAQRDPEFSGTLRYETRIALASRADRRVWIELSGVCYSAEVLVNGRSCGRRAWQPFWFEITGAIQAGMNDIQVRVTNTLANQWACSRVRERDFRLWKNPYLEKTAPWIDESCHAGLAGPVTIHWAEAESDLASV